MDGSTPPGPKDTGPKVTTTEPMPAKPKQKGSWRQTSITSSGSAKEDSLSDLPGSSQNGAHRRRLGTELPLSYEKKSSSELRDRAFTVSSSRMDKDRAEVWDQVFWDQIQQKLRTSEITTDDLARELRWEGDDDGVFDEEGDFALEGQTLARSSSIGDRGISSPTPGEADSLTPIAVTLDLGDLCPELKHTDLNRKDSLLSKVASKAKLELNKWPRCEVTHFQASARQYLGSLAKEQMTEASLTAFLNSYKPLVNSLLPETCEVMAQQMGMKAPITVRSLKELFSGNKKVREEWKRLLNDTLNYLHESPYNQASGPSSLLLQTTRCQDLQTHWVTFEHEHMSTLPKFKDAFAKDMKSVSSAFTAHNRMLFTLAENDFRSKDNFTHSVNLLFGTALKTLESLPNAPEALKEALVTIHMQAISFNGSLDQMIGLLAGFQKKILELFRQHKLDKLYQRYLIEEIQEKEGPKPIEKKLALKYGDQYHYLDVQYKPAAMLEAPAPEDDLDAISPEGGVNPFHPPYQGKFCPSMNRAEAEHAVNLMTVDVCLEGETDPVYQEVRMGIPYAFAVKERTREAATHHRWEEAFVATLVQSHSKELEEALSNPNHEPIALPMMYKCLLSPDKLRPHLPEHELVDPELVWCNKTWQKVEELNTAVQEVKVRDHCGEVQTIRVKPDISMFIDPCNNIAFNPVMAMSKTWEYADDVNEKTLTRWMGSLQQGDKIGGKVEIALRDQSLPKVYKQELVELVSLIRFMWEGKRFHKLTNNPLYMSNLTSELGRVLKQSNLIGCKSAKDRTGNKSQSDIKMAMDCEMNRRRWSENFRCSIVPLPEAPFTEDDIFNACQLTLNSGQLENQLKNTAIPGYKMQDYMLGPAKAVYSWISRKVSSATGWLKLK